MRRVATDLSVKLPSSTASIQAKNGSAVRAGLPIAAPEDKQVGIVPRASAGTSNSPFGPRAEFGVLEHLGSDFLGLLRDAPGFVAVLEGQDHRFVFANEAYHSLVGHRPLIGRGLLDALPEIECQEFPALLDEVLQTGMPFRATCAEALLEDERGELTRRRLDFVYEPIVDRDDVVIGIFISGLERGAEAIELEQRANKAGDFVDTLAHEINQPLAAARMYLSASKKLAKKIGEGRMIEGVGQAERQLSRIQDIVTQARLSVSGRTTGLENVSLSVLVQDTITLLSATDLCHDIEIETEFEAPADFVHVNRIQVEQVFTNILRNACQAMSGSRHAKKSLRIISRMHPEGTVEIEISDNGPGTGSAASIMLGDVGEPTETRGMGLGVPISRKIIRDHSGHLWWNRNGRGGTSFFFTLPAPVKT